MQEGTEHKLTARFRLRRHDDVGAFARSQHREFLFHGVLEEAAITADLSKDVSLSKIQFKVAALCRIDDPPALRHAGPSHQVRGFSAVDQDVVAFSAEGHTCPRASAVGWLEGPVLTSTDVAQYDNEIVGHAHVLVRVLDEKPAVQPEADLAADMTCG